MTKLMFYLLVCVAVFSTTVAVEEGSKIHRQKRLSCQLGGASLCGTSCLLHGRYHGGCCGTSGPCRNICYCNGSGYEHRCHRCDLG